MWIARDKDGDLYLYTKEPEKYVQEGFFSGISRPDMDVCGIDRTSFPSVTWENSPQKVTVELASPTIKPNPVIIRGVHIDLDGDVANCGFSVRAMNCLKAADITTVRELVRYHRCDLLKFRNFGERSLNEIEDFLTEHGLTFGMKV